MAASLITVLAMAFELRSGRGMRLRTITAPVLLMDMDASLPRDRPPSRLSASDKDFLRDRRLTTAPSTTAAATNVAVTIVAISKIATARFIDTGLDQYQQLKLGVRNAPIVL